MKTSFNKLYQSVFEQMGAQPAVQAQQQTQQQAQPPAQQGQATKPQPADPKQLATQIAGIKDPELLSAIQQLLAAKAPASAAPAAPAQQPQQQAQTNPNAPKQA